MKKVAGKFFSVVSRNLADSSMLLILVAMICQGCAPEGVCDDQPVDDRWFYAEIVNTTEYDIKEMRGVAIGKTIFGPIIPSGDAKWIRVYRKRNGPNMCPITCLVGGALVRNAYLCAR